MMALTSGEFIVGMYDAWGKRRARGIIRLAVEARLIVFQGHKPLDDSQGERVAMSVSSDQNVSR